jgi:hypothetical protein
MSVIKIPGLTEWTVTYSTEIPTFFYDILLTASCAEAKNVFVCEVTRMKDANPVKRILDGMPRFGLRAVARRLIGNTNDNRYLCLEREGYLTSRENILSSCTGDMFRVLRSKPQCSKSVNNEGRRYFTTIKGLLFHPSKHISRPVNGNTLCPKILRFHKLLLPNIPVSFLLSHPLFALTYGLIRVDYSSFQLWQLRLRRGFR